MAAQSNQKAIRTQAIKFVKTWKDESRGNAEATSFWDAFFKVFGLASKDVAAYEYVVECADNSYGYIDLFAENTGIFAHHQFYNYLIHFTKEDGSDVDMHLRPIKKTSDLFIYSKGVRVFVNTCRNVPRIHLKYILEKIFGNGSNSLLI
jgi:hypothetical protein